MITNYDNVTNLYFRSDGSICSIPFTSVEQMHFNAINTISEINQFLNFHPGAIEISFWGTITIKFEHFSFELIELIKKIRKIALETDVESAIASSIVYKIENYLQSCFKQALGCNPITEIACSLNYRTNLVGLEQIKQALGYIEVAI